MTHEAQKALAESIVKWRANTTIARLEDIKIGASSCPLCELFLERGCTNCPVANVTGIRGCKRTPYDAVEEWYEKKLEFTSREEHDVLLAEFREIAKAEVAFLEGLLT